MITHEKIGLEHAITPVISPSCTHMKDRGGAKGCIQDVQKHAAHFDGASYYDSIDHAILLSQLEEIATPLPCIAIISQYLTEPDRDPYRGPNNGWWIEILSPRYFVPDLRVNPEVETSSCWGVL